jgi:N-methylhydantoinase A/oxoprolinase/acetone carboxylase beta subunit
MLDEVPCIIFETVVERNTTIRILVKRLLQSPNGTLMAFMGAPTLSATHMAKIWGLKRSRRGIKRSKPT